MDMDEAHSPSASENEESFSNSPDSSFTLRGSPLKVKLAKEEKKKKLLERRISESGGGDHLNRSIDYEQHTPEFKPTKQHRRTGSGIQNNLIEDNVLRDPETQFEQIIQKGNEYLSEVNQAIIRFKTSQCSEINLIEAESQIQKTIVEVSRISKTLQDYLDEVSLRRVHDSFVSPRVLTSIKARNDSLNGLNISIRKTKRDLQIAFTERERKDLLSDWSIHSSPKRNQRDAEEIMSDSTERLLNSKRILLETIQASSGTLGALATSSQSIQKNDEELNNQTDSISSAQSLLQKYGRRASTDKHLIWLGFLFFGFCAVLVAYRRLF